MKTYKKPETKIVLFPAGEYIMQIIENSVGTGNVGGYDNPDDPDLAPAHHFEVEEEIIMDTKWNSVPDEGDNALERKVQR